MRQLILRLTLLVVGIMIGFSIRESMLPDLSQGIALIEYCRDSHAEWALKDSYYLDKVSTNRERELEWVRRYQEHIENLQRVTYR